MAIAMNSGAALRFLEHSPPALDEVRSGLSKIVFDSHRASQVFENIGSLFKGGDQDLRPVELNEVVLGVLRILRNALKEYGVTTRMALSNDLPPVLGHQGQLQEVLLNLVQNALDSMSSNIDRSRILRVTTERLGLSEIAVAVEDTGPGIDPKQLPNLFEAFFTSKAQGMGLGLAISQMIIERHGGQISASSDAKLGGAIFRFVLPIRSAKGSEAGLS